MKTTLIPKKHFTKYIFTSKQREAVNWQLNSLCLTFRYLESLVEIKIESRLYCINICDYDFIIGDDYISHVIFILF